MTGFCSKNMNPFDVNDPPPVYSYRIDWTTENWLVLRNLRMTADERNLLTWLDRPQGSNVNPDMEDPTSLPVEQQVDRDLLAMEKWKHIRCRGDSGWSSPASHPPKDASETSSERKEHAVTTAAAFPKAQTNRSSATVQKHTRPSRRGSKTLREPMRRDSKKGVKRRRESSGRAQKSSLSQRGFSIPSGWSTTLAGGRARGERYTQ
ncbi:hypothetical protein N7523_011159 [Penicillium sp. IBT 18751x]|nr:hypothetical protein N7523_011159 [Penicillium sp. IBT 18751x]